MDGFINSFISSFISYLYSLDNLDWSLVLGFFLLMAGALDVYVQGRKYLNG